MVLVTFAGTKVTRARADTRIELIHREAIQNQGQERNNSYPLILSDPA
jgi:hypothetical protein